MRFLLESPWRRWPGGQLPPEIWLYFSSGVDLFARLGENRQGWGERLTVYKLHESEQWRFDRNVTHPLSLFLLPSLHWQSRYHLASSLFSSLIFDAGRLFSSGFHDRAGDISAIPIAFLKFSPPRGSCKNVRIKCHDLIKCIKVVFCRSRPFLILSPYSWK